MDFRQHQSIDHVPEAPYGTAGHATADDRDTTVGVTDGGYTASHSWGRDPLTTRRRPFYGTAGHATADDRDTTVRVTDDGYTASHSRGRALASKLSGGN